MSRIGTRGIYPPRFDNPRECPKCHSINTFAGKISEEDDMIHTSFVCRDCNFVFKVRYVYVDTYWDDPDKKLHIISMLNTN